MFSLIFVLLDPKGSSFILDMTEQLLEMSWHCKGKYSPVGALVGHLGASRVLYLRPQLPSELLRHAAEQQLATYVSSRQRLHKTFYATIKTDCLN